MSTAVAYSGDTKAKGPPAFKHKVNDQVVVKWPDGFIYYATIKKIIESRQLCELAFPGNKRGRASFSEILRVDEPIPDNKWIACVVCKFGDSDAPNEIVLCDTCNISYHQLCHNPNIPDQVVKDTNFPWVCRFCETGTENPHIKGSDDEEEAETPVAVRRQPPASASTTRRRTLSAHGPNYAESSDESPGEDAGSSDIEMDDEDEPVTRPRQTKRRLSTRSLPEPPKKKKLKKEKTKKRGRPRSVDVTAQQPAAVKKRRASEPHTKAGTAHRIGRPKVKALTRGSASSEASGRIRSRSASESAPVRSPDQTSPMFAQRRPKKPSDKPISKPLPAPAPPSLDALRSMLSASAAGTQTRPTAFRPIAPKGGTAIVPKARPYAPAPVETSVQRPELPASSTKKAGLFHSRHAKEAYLAKASDALSIALHAPTDGIPAKKDTGDNSVLLPLGPNVKPTILLPGIRGRVAITTEAQSTSGHSSSPVTSPAGQGATDRERPPGIRGTRPLQADRGMRQSGNSGPANGEDSLLPATSPRVQPTPMRCLFGQGPEQNTPTLLMANYFDAEFKNFHKAIGPSSGTMGVKFTPLTERPKFKAYCADLARAYSITSPANLNSRRHSKQRSTHRHTSSQPSQHMSAIEASLRQSSHLAPPVSPHLHPRDPASHMQRIEQQMEVNAGRQPTQAVMRLSTLQANERRSLPQSRAAASLPQALTQALQMRHMGQNTPLQTRHDGAQMQTKDPGPRSRAMEFDSPHPPMERRRQLHPVLRGSPVQPIGQGPDRQPMEQGSLLQRMERSAQPKALEQGPPIRRIDTPPLLHQNTPKQRHGPPALKLQPEPSMNHVLDQPKVINEAVNPHRGYNPGILQGTQIRAGQPKNVLKSRGAALGQQPGQHLQLNPKQQQQQQARSSGQSKGDRTCIGCNRPANLICSVCNEIWYCSARCQELYYTLRCGKCVR